MNRSDIQFLQTNSVYPSLSILMPTHRRAPENRQDPIRFKNLIKQATERLLVEFDRREIEPLLERLETLTAQIDWRKTRAGLALFVNRHVARQYDLPFPVTERVVIEERFATREPVYALNHTVRFWVLSLSRPVRLYEGVQDVLREVESGGFPLSPEEISEREPAPGSRGVERTAHREARNFQFFRKVDAAANEILSADPLPLFVAGTERWLSFFCNCSKNKHLIAGVLRGNHAQTPASELADLVRPLVAGYLARERLQALKDFELATGSGRAVSGITRVWHMAKEAFGAMLLVEQDLYYPARLSSDGVSLASAADLSAGEPIEDAVDEIIEAVLARKGRVVFVDRGALDADGRIALILPYWMEWKNAVLVQAGGAIPLAAVGGSQ